MNSQLEKMFGKVTGLNTYDISSVLGSILFMVQAQAIYIVMRLIPDAPEEGSGIEQFTRWEQAMKAPEIAEQVSPLVGLAKRVADLMEQYTDNSRPPNDFANTLEFMTSPERAPTRAQFQAEYNQRSAMGMRPQIPLKAFIDGEMATALARHHTLVARGGDAVRMLGAIDGEDGEVPENLLERIQNKVLDKLAARWTANEIRRTNPKLPKEARDEAEAAQRMIEGVIDELGGKAPNYKAEMAADDAADASAERIRRIAANAKAAATNPKAPGPAFVVPPGELGPDDRPF